MWPFKKEEIKEEQALPYEENAIKELIRFRA